jgi:hypothetical protein
VHAEAFEWVSRYATDEPVSLLSLGGRDVNGNCDSLFPKAAITVLDIRPGDGVDIVADAATWDPGDQRWDVVLSTECFEHTASWRAICRTAYAACAPGGRLIVTTAAPGRAPHSAVDGAFRLLPGEHYANIRPAELERVLVEAGWADVVVDVQPSPADVRAVAAKRKKAP